MLNPCALDVPYGVIRHERGAVCTLWELWVVIWEVYVIVLTVKSNALDESSTLDGSRMVPLGGLMLYGSSIAPCGSHVRPYGTCREAI
jgi:hypothetical protein